MTRNNNHYTIESVAGAVVSETRRAMTDNDTKTMLREFGIYDWYYSRQLFETESTNDNEWDEVRDLLGQMGRVTGALLKKLTQIGKRKVARLCVERGREIFREHKDLGAAVKYTFWSLLFFAIAYTGNTLKERYNEHPVVPGTELSYEQKDGTDTMTVTNARGGAFTVQARGEEAPKIVNVKKSDVRPEKVKSDVKPSGDNGSNVSPIMLLKPGEKHPEFYHGSPQIYRAIAEVEQFVDHIYDAKDSKKQIRKEDMMNMKKDLTIGYGHKLTKEERRTMAFNTRWTKEKAFEVFKKDIREHESIMNSKLRTLHYYDDVVFSQGFIDACLSIFFNSGSGNMTGSATRVQSEFWRRLNNCRVDRENGCIDRSDVYFTISQLRHQFITEPGHVARREQECQIAQQLGSKVNPDLYNLKKITKKQG